MLPHFAIIFKDLFFSSTRKTSCRSALVAPPHSMLLSSCLTNQFCVFSLLEKNLKARIFYITSKHTTRFYFMCLIVWTKQPLSLLVNTGFSKLDQNFIIISGISDTSIICQQRNISFVSNDCLLYQKGRVDRFITENCVCNSLPLEKKLNKQLSKLYLSLILDFSFQSIYIFSYSATEPQPNQLFCE